jgi:uncharacterized protein YpmB
MSIANIIFLILLILLLIWVLNKMFFRTNIIYDKILKAADENNGENNNVINNSDFLENNTSNFMLSVWFFVDSWGKEISNEKNILFMATDNQKNMPNELSQSTIGISNKHCVSTTDNPFKNLNICLDKYENNLFIDIETYQDAGDSSACYTRYKIENIPIQKWNCLTLSVDTRTLDIYLDGKLRNSFILHGIYKNKYEDNSKKNIYLGNNGISYGFEGFITRVRYEPNSINPQEAYNIYRDGINASLVNSIFNKYRLKVSFLEYNKERGSFQI